MNWTISVVAKPFQVAILHGDLNKPFPSYPNQDWASNDYGIFTVLNGALAELEGYCFTYFANHDNLFGELRADLHRFDLVFNLCDDGYRNNLDQAGHVVALLEMLGVPFTGSGVKAMFMTTDKQIQLDIAHRNGVPTPPSLLVQPWEPLPAAVSYPALVKPNATDGSIGITRKNVVHNRGELHEAVRIIREDFRLTCPILIQRYLPGRDLFVSLLGNAPDDLHALVITEEDYSALPPDYPKFCSYESKWDPTSPYWQIKSQPTTLPAASQQLMIDCCRRLYARLEIHDYARFDWRLDEDDQPYFLEANPNCGWCFDAHLVKTAALSGMSYSELLDRILRAALRRYGKV
jgi:D-alanine-D-alanine ligase